MRKTNVHRMLSAILLCVLSISSPVCQAVYAEPSGQTYSVKQVPVNRGGLEVETVSLRFYDDMPSVPYISVAEFQALMLPGTTIGIAKNGDEYTLTGPYATATVNTATEQFSSDDFMAFTNLMGLIQPGMDNVYLDGAPFIRYKSRELTPAQVTVTFDFKKYGIDLRGDEEAVYFPLATIGDLYSDLYYHIVGYNGEKVVVVTDNDNSELAELEPERAEALLAQTTRTADMAAFAYSELCFIIDHFYGMPGRSPWEDAIKQKGLDGALDSDITDGADIKQLLQSTSMQDYLFGMDCLQLVLDDGGHTYTSLVLDVKGFPELVKNCTAMQDRYPALVDRMRQFIGGLVGKASDGGVKYARENKGIDELTYYKEGDTAYLLYDVFLSNFAAWNDYYEGGCQGDTPDIDPEYKGDLSVVLDALRQANDDPEVKNLVIDLADNAGGSLDIVMAMTALMGGESRFYSENTLTGQRQVITYEVDCNFDGIFDERDKEVWKDYDLNYGVMTSRASFSCGNLLPSLMKDMGFPTIGQKSGGGACAVQQFATPEGLQFRMSSYRGRLTDKNWNSIDGGVEPTNPISITTEGSTAEDYSGFYDVAIVSDIFKTTTGIPAFSTPTPTTQGDTWYTIDGRRLSGQPTQKGVYIHNGKLSVFAR